MLQAPWTDIGSLQQDVLKLKCSLTRKANTYDIHEISGRVDSLEHSIREIRSLIDELGIEVQVLQEEKREEVV